MNDFLVDEIFKNAQRTRIKNQVEEKLLQTLIDGDKGIKQKLKKALSKIEKSKQTIEQDACQLEREMRVLGLSPRNRKPLSTSTTLLTSVMSSTAATVTPKVVIKNISAVEPPPPLVTQAYQQRRLSLEGLTYENRLYSDMKPMPRTRRRRNSLASSSLSQSPTSSTSSSSSYNNNSNSSTQSSHTASFIKSLRTSELVLVEPPTACIVKQRFNEVDSATTPPLLLNTTRTSLTGLRRKMSLTSGVDTTTTTSAYYDNNLLPNPPLHEAKRVSFGNIELSQLDIPKVYKHSNTGYERYKQNPHLYLPDGSLKRKFSLPKLSDSLRAVSECRYIRKRHSVSGSDYKFDTPNDSNEDILVTNVIDGGRRNEESEDYSDYNRYERESNRDYYFSQNHR